MSHPDDTQVLPTQVFNDWKATRSTRTGQCPAFDGGFHRKASEISLVDSTSSESGSEDNSALADHEGLDIALNRAEIITSPATFLSPNTPQVSTRRRSDRGRASTTKRRPCTNDFTRFFADQKVHAATNLSQIFDQTQATTSPIEDIDSTDASRTGSSSRAVKRQRLDGSLHRSPLGLRPSHNSLLSQHTSPLYGGSQPTDSPNWDGVTEPLSTRQAACQSGDPSSTDNSRRDNVTRAIVPKVISWDTTTQIINVVDSQQERSEPERLPLTGTIPAASNGIVEVDPSTSFQFPMSSPQISKGTLHNSNVARASRAVTKRVQSRMSRGHKEDLRGINGGDKPLHRRESSIETNSCGPECCMSPALPQSHDLDATTITCRASLAAEKTRHNKITPAGAVSAKVMLHGGKSAVNVGDVHGSRAHGQARAATAELAYNPGTHRSRDKREPNVIDPEVAILGLDAGAECLRPSAVLVSPLVSQTSKWESSDRDGHIEMPVCRKEVQHQPRSDLSAPRGRTDTERLDSELDELHICQQRDSSIEERSSRVFALFAGLGRTAYYTGRVLNRQDTSSLSLKVHFDDGNVADVKHHLILSLDLRRGDTVRVDENDCRAKKFIVEGFDRSVTTASHLDVEDAKSDIHGHDIVLLRQKNPRTMSKTTSTTVQRKVPISSLYISGDLIRHYKDRAWLNQSALMNAGRREIVRSRLCEQDRSLNISTESRGLSGDRDTTTKFHNSSRSGGVFAHSLFAVTFVKKDTAARSQICDLITDHGGSILDEGFDELFENYDPTSFPSEGAKLDASDSLPALRLKSPVAGLGFAALISDQYSRKVKYMQALALNLPCLSFRWVIDSVNHQQRLRWDHYLLPAGESSLLAGTVRSRTNLSFDHNANMSLSAIIAKRPMLLQGQKLLVVLGKGKAERRRWTHMFLARALGPRQVVTVPDIPAAKVTLQWDEEPFDWVYVDDRNLSRAKRALDHPHVVGDEFVVQTLILGSLLESG